MFLPFNRISYNIRRVTKWEDKEWYCVTTDTILLIEKKRAENKIAHAFLWCFQSYLFNYPTTERLHSLAANSTWFKSVKWWSVFDTCMIKVQYWLRDLENIKIIHPASRHEHWVGFKLWTTSINVLGSFFFVLRNNVISWGRVGGEGWLWILLGYYLLGLRWNDRWGDRRIRRKDYVVTLTQGC